jgi:hypothetical protein
MNKMRRRSQDKNWVLRNEEIKIFLAVLLLQGIV